MEQGFYPEPDGKTMIYHGHLDQKGQRKVALVGNHTDTPFNIAGSHWYVHAIRGLTREQHPVRADFVRYRESRLEDPNVAMDIILGSEKLVPYAPGSLALILRQLTAKRSQTT